MRKDKKHITYKQWRKSLFLACFIYSPYVLLFVLKFGVEILILFTPIFAIILLMLLIIQIFICRNGE